jgi:hypothetical protein
MPRTLRDLNIPELSFFVQDLVGGVDLNSAPTALPRGKSQELRNFSLQEGGALVSVEGWNQFSTTTLTGGNGRIQGGERLYIASAPLTIIAYNGTIRTVTDAGVISSALVSGLSTDNEIYFPQDSEVALVIDGVNVPKITADGVNFYTAGIAAPTPAPTLGVAAGGGLIVANTYEVSYTFGTTAAFHIDLVHEGNESPTATQATAGANLTVTVQALGTNDPKVNRVYVYARNVTAGQAVRRLIGSVASTDAATNWNFSITAEPSTLALAPPTNADLPLAFKYALFWQNRWWAFHPSVANRLHFTPVFQPQSWPAEYYLDISMDKGDELSAAQPLGDLLVLFGHAGIYLLTGSNVLEIDIRPALAVESGAFGPRSAVKVEAGIAHAGVAGISLFNVAQDLPIGKDIATGWRDLVQGYSSAALGKIALHYLTRLSHLQVSVPDLYPVGIAGEYVMDLARMRARGSEAWFKTDRDVGGYIAWNGNEPTAGDVGTVLSWPHTTGKLNEERVGFDADGADLSAVFMTAAQTTQFREALLVHGFVEYQPANGILIVDLFVEDILVNTQTFSINATSATYGDVVYGSATYGSAGRQKLPISFPLPAEGTVFFLRFTFQGTTRFKLFSYGFGTVPEPVIRTLV